MNFLQPWVLWALPLIGLPIAIHLIHKRRQRVVEWGAMMFLLQGIKMSRGMQRLRHFLLLLLRTLAVAGLLFVLLRPMAGGWLGGLGGGRPDTVLVLLDRSASMSEEVAPGSASKLEVGVQRIAEALDNVGAARLFCIDSVTLRATELDSARDLADLPLATETAAQADLPAMLEVAAEHLAVDSAGRAEIWICSDGQAADWRPEDGRWPALQEALVGLPGGVRVNVLNFRERAARNLSVRVERAERVEGEEHTELVLDLRVRGFAGGDEQRVVPLALHVAGARSVLQVELEGGEAELVGQRIPIDPEQGEGWGYVELPPDANPADNRFYFTYGAGALQETVVVWESEGDRDVLRFAAEAPSSDSVEYLARSLPADESADLDLEGSTLLLWQAPLPEDETALVVERFLQGGGRVVFLPPAEPTGASFLGYSWGPLRELGSAAEPASPAHWRSDGDLLRHGDDGTPLSVEDLHVRLLYPIEGDVTPLASFPTGELLLARAPTSRGGLYFLATTTATAASNLATQGVVLVAIVQRCLVDAAAAIGSRAQQDAGSFVPLAGEYELVSEAPETWLLSEELQHSGVVRSGESLVALNRSLAEDRSATLDDERLASLMPEVDVSWVAGGAEASGLVEEIWRLFLILMLVALVGEALLCVSESAPAPVPARGTRA